MKQTDYLILGAGASGLMLAYRMAKDPFFDHKSILIIDQEQNKGNDRTWCFWEKGTGEWDPLLSKEWSQIYFGALGKSKKISLGSFSYKMIRSEAFYKYIWNFIQHKENISFVRDEVTHIRPSEEQVQVNGKSKTYLASKVFNSIPLNQTYSSQKKYPVLKQHFIGWFIQTKQDAFDEETATFMDFNIEQKGNTRFMYVLPFGKKEALFEYTLFSENLLAKESYEEAIEKYLSDKNITDYRIVEKEQGSIPMTCYPFASENEKNIVHIGTAGGWTKASTGYTFANSSKKTKELVNFLKNNSDLSTFEKRSKYNLYDLLFLDVIAQHNELGSTIFSNLFQKVHIHSLFRFLNEESNLMEDLKIIFSVPSIKFTQAIFKRFLP